MFTAHPCLSGALALELHMDVRVTPRGELCQPSALSSSSVRRVLAAVRAAFKTSVSDLVVPDQRP
eukprot:1557133-Alexandrium_andersonii.AAC.1